MLNSCYNCLLSWHIWLVYYYVFKLKKLNISLNSKNETKNILMIIILRKIRCNTDTEKLLHSSVYSSTLMINYF